MALVRKNRPPTSTAIGKERAHTCPKSSGLAQNLKSVSALEACLQGKSPNLPDAEMIDAEPLSLINHGPETTRSSERATEIPSSSKGKEVVEDKAFQSIDLPARKIAVPVSKRTAATEASVYPPELHAVLEAEKRRAARITAHLSICSTAINSVEAALSPLSTGENKSFVDGIKIYLRAAIAQFLHTGPGSIPPSLPARPSCPLPSKAPEKRTSTSAIPQEQGTKSTWAKVARNGLRHSSAPPTTKEAPIAQKSSESTTKMKVDKRLFLRLANEDAWRNASPSFLQQKITTMAAIPSANISLVQRVKTGFAITATDETSREKILDLVLQEGRKIEPASNLVAYLIPTVPVKGYSPTASVSLTVETVTQEIIRVSNAVPSLVRPHGVSKLGAPHQNWIALFPRESAPRPGFKLFFESGRATIFRPRQCIEQCKRCLDFHATRGCSRAPACWNCGSKMHSERECKASARCRNCGGPHRSESRHCLARPARTGPATREQLVTIRQNAQREYAAVARARAAAKKLETTPDPTSKDVPMAEETGFSVLSSEEEA